MITVSIEQMQRDLLTYLHRVQEGETVVIVQGDKPIGELRPAAEPARQSRPFGLCAGEFRVPDDFDAPLPEEIVRQFEGA